MCVFDWIFYKIFDFVINKLNVGESGFLIF